MRRKKLIAGALALVMALSLAGCSGDGIKKAGETGAETAAAQEAQGGQGQAQESQGQETAGGATQIVIGDSMQYTSLDLAHSYESDAEMVLRAAYNTLVTTAPDDETTILPGLASEWSISEDGLTYVFQLKEGVKFTTGKEVKAEDVAYCFNRMSGVKGNPSFLLETVDSVEATGDYEVTVRLNTVNPAFLSIIARGFFGIYDSEVAKANGGTCGTDDTFEEYANSHPSVGSGAYQIVSYTSGSEVILEKFKDASVQQGKVDKYIIRNIADANTQLMEIEAGDIDFALDLTADQTASLEGAENIQLVPNKTYDLFFLLLNASEEYGKELANPKVREAIKYAIDYEGLCALAGNGAFTPDGIIPEGFLGYRGESTVTRDVEKARALLAEAGYPDGITFDCGVIPDMAPDGVSFMMCAEKMESDLKEAGITMNIVSQEVSVYLESYRDGKQQAVISQWGPDYFDSNNQLAFLPGNTVGLRAGWPEDMDPELAELGRQAAAEIDPDARKELLVEIQKQMDEKVSPYIVFLQAGRTWAVNTRIQNIIPSAAYMLDFATLEVAE